jgi:hypothetical protein
MESEGDESRNERLMMFKLIVYKEKGKKRY